MASEFIKISNYKVVNNIGKVTGEISVLYTNILLIIGVRATVDGRSSNLYNVFNNSGLMCTTNTFGLEIIMEMISGGEELKRPINTYTVINGVSRINDTRYCDFSTITKLSNLNLKTRDNIYECTTTSNYILFNTDGEGFSTILMSRELPDGPKKI